MIRQLFLPDRIGDLFIGTHTYVGIELTKTAVIATKIQVSGRAVMVTDLYQELITKTDEEDWEVCAVRALVHLNEKIGPVTDIRLAIPNNVVIFKELTVPFIDADKIRQILPFELEQHIPFSIADVAFDFIITAQDAVQKKAQIFVGIVQKKDVSYYLSLFERAHVELARITVDLFALYTMWLVHSDYAQHKASILIDINAQFSTVAYLKEQQLCAVRLLAQGTNSFAKAVAERIKRNPAAVMEQLVRFGVEQTDDAEFDQAVTAELMILCEPIKVTLDAFAMQIPTFEPVHYGVVLVRGAYFKGLDKRLQEVLGITITFFESANLFTTAVLKIRPALPVVTSLQVLSLGAVYPFGRASSFDLLSAYETKKSEVIIARQFIAALILFVTVFGLLIGVGYWRYVHARTYVRRARQAAMQQLNTEFNVSEQDLTSAVNTAEQELSTREATWEGFSSAQRNLFLRYLQELCVKIDRAGIGLQLKKLTMTKKSITLIGQVRDYPALKTFEKELESSSLFKLVSIPQEPSFDITLVITNDNGSNA